jgi:DNA-binding NarL/FixJ family response regulator
MPAQTMHSHSLLTDSSCLHAGRYALVIDDHPLTALGMAEFLKQFGVAEVHAVAGPDEGLQCIASRGSPLLAIVDFWLGAGAGTDVVRDIRTLAPACRVLMTSGDTHGAIALKARAAGAHGFVLKSHPPQVLEQALAALLRGEPWFTEAPLQPTAQGGPHAIRMTAAELGLTPRQAQVLDLVLRGLPNPGIAQLLHLSPHTVKEHVAGALQRLGVHSRIDAITRMQGIALELPPSIPPTDTVQAPASSRLRCSTASSA